ncbi:hypothetical protein ABZ419_11430 [Streptomyces cinnamoneus]|uniref:hypothetical protein n=1 Tax=Streptomyces cinnamoneus TaxID=53446 RepID=UPI0033DF74C8
MRVTLDLTAPEPEPEPGTRQRLQEWITGYVKPRQAILCLAGAVIPIHWTGYSVATTWAYTVHEARDIAIPLGYALGLGTFAIAGWRFIRTGRLLTLYATVVTFIGVFGAIDFFDPVTALTGVHQR